MTDAIPATEIQQTAAKSRWTRPVKCLVSLWLIYHLFAIVVAPWSVPPSSLLSRECWSYCHPYLEALHLNHGYHFFAPDPGPSHLLRYEARLNDGTTVSGVIPDLNVQRPRLLYHRHFMLTEHLNRLAIEADASEEPALFQSVTRGYADHLLDEHDAESVTLYLRRHYIPSPVQVQEGMSLDDRRLYAERPLGRFHANETERENDAERSTDTARQQSPQRESTIR